MNSKSREDSITNAGASLSAQALFQWHKKDNSSMPQRGGTKDYEPDGSWMQAKRLEAFYDELQGVLAEPRVEKSGNLVRGTWQPDKNLVNIEKTAKFWMKMGFSDQQQNWLHPEEALFLLEVNCLDLQHHGVSLSLQEAYNLLLHSSTGITEEEYQVYAHLRRIGYIVVRHAGKLDITGYERKIGLDKHIKKTKKKCRKKADVGENINSGNHPNISQEQVSPMLGVATVERNCSNLQSTPTGLVDDDNNTALNCSYHSLMEVNGEVEHNTHSNINNSCRATDVSMTCSPAVDSNERCHSFNAKNHGEMNCLSLKACPTSDNVSFVSGSAVLPVPMTEMAMCANSNRGSRAGGFGNPGKRQLVLDGSDEEPPCKTSKESSDESSESQVLEKNAALDVWSCATQQSLSASSDTNGPRKSSQPAWDFSTIPLPDMGQVKDTLCLALPPSQFLPPNTCMDEDYEDCCLFDVEEYRRQQLVRNPYSQNEKEEDFGHLKQFEFSYAEWLATHSQPVHARNWTDWKSQMKKRNQNVETPVSHLWQGKVTPLVEPMDAVSTDSILRKLSVVKPFQGPIPRVSDLKYGHIKISFDVYLPNTNFRKSKPGLPDHRLCVARSDKVPDLFEVLAATAHLNDGVPLHWAVVSSGDVSFHVFDQFELPVHYSSLG